MADFLKIFKQVSDSLRSATCPLACIMAVASLSACEALNPPVPGTDVNFAPTYASPIDPRQIKNADGSIYHAETALPLFETPRARHPGDIVTVILIEKTDAKKQATTRSMKNDKIGIAVPEFFGKPISIAGGYNLDFNVNAQRQFNGDTQAVQNNKLAGAISVTVAKEFSNGNLFIQGEKWIQINQGKEFVRLSGIIRPQDIKADNTITSERVANARIYYGGVGQVNNTNAQGWFSRFLWGPLYLF